MDTASDQLDQVLDRLHLQAFRPPLTPERVRFEVEGLIHLLNLAPSAPILNLACGQGEHALELARRGYDVTGLDVSDQLLTEGQRTAEAEGLSIKWVRRDLRRIPFRGSFDAVVTFVPVLGLSESPEDNRATVHAMYRALRPGGRVLFETIHRERLVREFVPRKWSEADGIRILEDQAWDLVTNELRTRWIVLLPDHREITRTSTIRVYPAHEIAELVRAGAFQGLTAYGDYDGQPYGVASQRLLLAAKRPVSLLEAPPGVSVSRGEPI